MSTLVVRSALDLAVLGHSRVLLLTGRGATSPPSPMPTWSWAVSTPITFWVVTCP